MKVQLDYFCLKLIAVYLTFIMQAVTFIMQACLFHIMPVAFDYYL